MRRPEGRRPGAPLVELPVGGLLHKRLEAGLGEKTSEGRARAPLEQNKEGTVSGLSGFVLCLVPAAFEI